MGKYIFGGVVVFVVFTMWSSWRFSKRIFTDEHYVEVGETLLKLRKVALDNMGGGDDGSPDGAVTSAGLALSYSINQEGDEFYHHVAVSTPNRRTLHAIGDRFVHYSMWILGLPTDRFRLEASQTSVHHGKVNPSQDEQRELLSRARKVPSPAEIQEIMREYINNPPQCHKIVLEGLETNKVRPDEHNHIAGF